MAPLRSGEGRWPTTPMQNASTRRLRGCERFATGLDHEAVKDYTQLNKEHLTPAVCAALGIDAHEHHHVVGNVDEGASLRPLFIGTLGT